jgi:hypothetical protein
MSRLRNILSYAVSALKQYVSKMVCNTLRGNKALNMLAIR